MLSAAGTVVALRHAPPSVTETGPAAVSPEGILAELMAPDGPYSTGPGRAPTAPAGSGQRVGYDSDVPWGGASRLQPGGDYPGGRETFMASLRSAYVACPWFSAAVDAVARTVTAGGVRVVPDPDCPDVDPEAPPDNVLRLRALLKFVNPTMDMVQLLRGAAVDLGIYGDAFIEIVWLLGEPVALYPLDPATMSVTADEHGNVTGYTQTLDTRSAEFEPDQIIHIPADSPGGSLYGMGIGQKALLPITIWLYTAACIKETMRRGNPPHIHMDWPMEVQPADVRAWRAQYRTQNLGPGNIGTPITTSGGAHLTELQLTKLADYLDILTNARDTILSEAGVPPAKVGVIESGNIGGGTGSAQDKTFDKNTCGPVNAAIMEKLTFHLATRGFGITDWIMQFTPVDWRDDAAVEEIRDKRLRAGAWTLNDYLIDIGKPPVEDVGDVHALITTKEILTWDQVQDYALAAVAAIQAKTTTADAQAAAARDHAAAAKDAAAAGHPPPAGVEPGPVPGQAPPPHGGVGDQPDDDAGPRERSPAAGRLVEHYRRVLAATQS